METADLKIKVTSDVNQAIAELEKFKKEVNSVDSTSVDANKKLSDSFNNMKGSVSKSLNEVSSNFKKTETAASSLSSSTGSLVGSLSSIINPTTLLIGAVVAAAAAFYKWATATSEAEITQRQLNETIGKAVASVQAESVSLIALVNVARDANNSYADRKQAIDTLNKQYPQYLGFLTTENVNTQAATRAIVAQIFALQNLAKQKGLAKLVDKTAEELEAAKQKAREDLKNNRGALPEDANNIKVLEIRLNEFTQTLIKNTEEQNKNAVASSKLAPRGTLAAIDAQIKKLKELKETVATTPGEIAKLNGLIKQLEATRNKFDPKEIRGAKTPSFKAPKNVNIKDGKEAAGEFLKGITEEFTTKPIRFNNAIAPAAGGLPARGAAPAFDPALAAIANQILLQQQAEKTGAIVSGLLTPAFDAMFTSIIEGGANAGDAFAKALKGIVTQLTITLIKTAALAGILSLISGGASAASGKGFGFLSAFKSLLGGKSPFANAEGGVFTRPTLLGNHLFGEAGKEAIVPLNRFKEFQGGGSQPIQVSVSGSFRGSGGELLYVIDQATARRGRNG